MRGISLALAAMALAGTASARTDAEPAVRAAVTRLIALSDAGALQGPEARALLSGELEGTTQNSFGRTRPPDRIILLGADRAVARLPGEGERPDFYFYLRLEDGSWHIAAARALAATDMHRVRRSLRALGTRTAEQEAQLANTELSLASDRALAAWFAAHRAELDRLRTLAGTTEGEALWRALHLNGVLTRDGIVHVSIGGMADNEVGFLHIADPALVPPIDPSDHIWIEPLGDGWYLFRTT